MPKTRSNSNHVIAPLFNEIAQPLHTSRNEELPTIKDILCAIYFHRNAHNADRGTTSYKDIVKYIVPELISIWKRNSLPTVTPRRVNFMVNQNLQRYNRLCTELKNRKTAALLKKIDDFKVEVIISLMHSV